MGKEGTEKTKVSAGRKQAPSLGGETQQPTWNRWDNETLWEESQAGCRDRWWGGLRWKGLSGGPQGREGAHVLLDGGKHSMWHMAHAKALGQA